MHPGYVRYATAAAAIMMTFAVIAAAQDMPKPELRFVQRVEHEENGRRFIGFELEVVNRGEYSDELFLATPVLPPCGKNTSASRTWVNIYDERKVRLYGHCMIKTSAELASIRFAVPAGGNIPKKIYIDLVDRFEERVVKSNMVSLE